MTNLDDYTTKGKVTYNKNRSHDYFLGREGVKRGGRESTLFEDSAALVWFNQNSKATVGQICSLPYIYSFGLSFLWFLFGWRQGFTNNQGPHSESPMNKNGRLRYRLFVG